MESAGQSQRRMTDGWLGVDVDTPALLLDLQKFEKNLDDMHAIAMANDVELIPHAKTHRMPDAAVFQLKHCEGLSVAKLGEAEGFARAGVTRMFMAYPVVGEAKMPRALALHTMVDMTFAVDSEDGASALGGYFADAGQVAKVMITIDSGLGRDGVSFSEAPDLADFIGATAGLQLIGIYTHEGTVYSAADADDLEQQSLAVAGEMVRTADAIRARGHELPVVSLGASASARIAARAPGVTQVRPGIYAFNDVGQIALGNATADTCAVRVIATVVSHPEVGRACIDAGSKSLSRDLVPASAHRPEYPGYGLIVNAPGWQIEQLSEEHGWLRWVGDGSPTDLTVGTRLEIIPNHVCMVFAMLRRATVIREGIIVGSWDGLGPGTSV